MVKIIFQLLAAIPYLDVGRPENQWGRVAVWAYNLPSPHFPAKYVIRNWARFDCLLAKEEETRLDFIVKLNRKTGDTIGPAWKNFGYRGSRYHDGFLYGKVDGKKELTGKYYNFRGSNF